MSPIIEIQRRLVEAGRIRAGEKGTRGEPRKLENWRLTSKDKQRLDMAAELWGGDVRPWEGRDGEFELYTETNQLPIMLIPGQLPTTWYELWTRGGCQRRCDGEYLNSEEPCACDPENRECKPYSRLSVLLPDLPGIGSWLLTSTGWNAAREWIGSADLLQRASAQGVLIPARLRLESRHEIKGGQTRRFAVPVIDLDISFRELLGGVQGALPSSPQRALPEGYKPIPQENPFRVSLAEGLREAETQELTRKPRVELPSDDGLLDDDIPFGEWTPLPGPGAEPSAPAAAGASPHAAPSAPELLTEKQFKALNTLVGNLRDKAGVITTQQLWSRVASMRGLDVENMVTLLNGRDDEGDLHWSPLRDSLMKDEASNLIERLSNLEANVGATA